MLLTLGKIWGVTVNIIVHNVQLLIHVWEYFSQRLFYHESCGKRTNKISFIAHIFLTRCPPHPDPPVVGPPTLLDFLPASPPWAISLSFSSSCSSLLPPHLAFLHRIAVPYISCRAVWQGTVLLWGSLNVVIKTIFISSFKTSLYLNSIATLLQFNCDSLHYWAQETLLPYKALVRMRNVEGTVKTKSKKRKARPSQDRRLCNQLLYPAVPLTGKVYTWYTRDFNMN